VVEEIGSDEPKWRRVERVVEEIGYDEPNKCSRET